MGKVKMKNKSENGRDYKLWLAGFALFLSLLSPFLTYYANSVVVDYRLKTIESTTNAVEWGKYKNTVDNLERQVSIQWERIRELREKINANR